MSQSQIWADTRTEMDMALHEEKPQVTVEKPLKESTGIITGYSVCQEEPNKATIKIWLSVPVTQSESQQFTYTETLNISDKNNSELTCFFESDATGNIKTPVSKEVQLEKEDGTWTYNGVELTKVCEKLDIDPPSNKNDLHTYYKTLMEYSDDTPQFDLGSLDDFYVLNSPPNFEQDYIVGLFIKLPTGKTKVIEVPHDDENPSDVLKDLVDVDTLFSKQIGKDIPVVYIPKEEKWVMYDKKVNVDSFIGNLLKRLGIYSVKQSRIIEFGRDFGLVQHRPLPKKPTDVPTEQQASIED